MRLCPVQPDFVFSIETNVEVEVDSGGGDGGHGGLANMLCNVGVRFDLPFVVRVSHEFIVSSRNETI